jgi:hypothetical protein
MFANVRWWNERTAFVTSDGMSGDGVADRARYTTTPAATVPPFGTMMMPLRM